MQYVIYTYMKHLGVRVKEPRSLESKRVRINFLPKIKVRNGNSSIFTLPSCLICITLSCFTRIQKSIKTEKEGEEKKKPRFPSILGPQRRPSRIEAAPGDWWLLKIAELFKTKSFISYNKDFDTAFVSVLSGQGFGWPSPAAETAVSAYAWCERAHGSWSSKRQPIKRRAWAHSLHVCQHFILQQCSRELGQQSRRWYK